MTLCLLVTAFTIAPTAFNRTSNGPSRVVSDIMTLSDASQAFMLDCGRFPSNSEGLEALVIAPPGVRGWRGPYLQQALPLDPWGYLYHYRYPGAGAMRPSIVCYGADGVAGGTGRDMDTRSEDLL